MRLRSWVLVVAVVLLAGCSSSDPSERSAERLNSPLAGLDVSDVSDAQAAEIDDHAATADEYQAAFQRYRECLSAAGFELGDVAFENSVYEFGVPDAAVQDGADEECYLSEFRYTDMLWQGTDAVQDKSDTTQVLRECLGERGIDPGDTREKVDGQLREAGIEVSECFS